MPWQKNGTPNTLLVNGTLSIDDLTAQDNNQFLTHQIQAGAVLSHRIDSIATTTYAERISDNGNADATNISQTELETATSGTSDEFCNMYGINIGDQEKLFIADIVGANDPGNANVPRRREYVGKQVGISSQYTSIETVNSAAINSNLSILSDVVPIPAAVGGWVELGRTSASGSSVSMDVTGLANKRYYMVLSSMWGTGSNVRHRLGNGSFDTSTNYAQRYAADGAADATAPGATSAMFDADGTTFDHKLGITYISNLSANEKLMMVNTCTSNTAAATVAPKRTESVSKWVNTSNPLDRIRTYAGSNLSTADEIVVLGWDPDDIHTNNFWEELDSTTFSGSASTFDTGTFTAKKYLWIQGWVEGTSSLRPGSFQFNTDTAGNYSIRRSHNDAADATFANTSSIDTQGGGSVTNYYFNMFVINNSSNEKLVTYNSVSFATAGAGTAPLRDEMAGKWANTASQITNLTVRSGDSGSLTSAEIRVWGSD